MTLHAAANPLDEFKWERQPETERLLRDDLVDPFLAKNSFARELARRMKEDTGTRFHDWIDTIVMPASSSPALPHAIAQVGYEEFHDRAGEQLWINRLGMFPRIALTSAAATQVHLKVTSVVDFADVWRIHERIEGEPLAPYRRVRASHEGDAELWASERWGWTGMELLRAKNEHAVETARTLESFLTRERDFLATHDADGYAHASRLIDASPLPMDLKCALFFEAERRYWQRRNRAAQVQKARQDKLGLGWGNHDHHTYRCSRRNFKHLVALFEKLGFLCRERFYAGREAGWGAQVMEQTNAGIITFNDVDLTPDELMGDFSHDGLAERDKLGTVGLWCALHGDSFNQAGMHHLEAQFDFDSLVEQLARHDVKTMKPFTNFPFLRQAFTEGERWQVDPRRIDRLLAEKLITPEQAAKFRAEGAIGSHLENLERNEGFKGFNQTGVSEIIAATDPEEAAFSSPINLRLLKLALVGLISLSAFSCSDSAHATAAVSKPAKDVAPTTQPGQLKTAVLAGGCFWASEEAFDQLAGVADVVSGYAGGTAETASYEEYNKSNHAEVVEIKYDPAKISYGKLLQVLFSFIDPTQVDAQGPDVGHGYRSAIFYANADEKAVAEAYIKQLTDARVFHEPIATTVEPLEKFYPAESYHQNYLKDPNHREESYVRSVSLKKVEKVRQAFKGELKPDATK